MIILLTGPTGSGKTDTSWELLKKFKQIVFLDCDWFASKVPFSWENNRDVEIIYQSISHMIEFYLSKKEKNFVITLTKEMFALYPQYSFYFNKFKLSIYAFMLKCDYKEIEQRIINRDRVQLNLELKNVQEQLEFFDEEENQKNNFNVIDTTKLNENEVASIIVSTVNSVR